MGRTASTEPQCLYKGALYLTVELYLYSHYGPYGLYRASVPVQGCTLPYSRAIPLLPQWAVRPVQSLSACTRAHFSWKLPEWTSKYNTILTQSDLLTNNIEHNTIIISLTCKIIHNTSGWLRVTKWKCTRPWTSHKVLPVTQLNSHEASTESCGHIWGNAVNQISRKSLNEILTELTPQTSKTEWTFRRSSQASGRDGQRRGRDKWVLPAQVPNLGTNGYVRGTRLTLRRLMSYIYIYIYIYIWSTHSWCS